MKPRSHTLFASLLLAALAAIAPLSYGQGVPQATVQFSLTGLSVTAPPVAGVTRLEVRIMGPAGTLVFDARSAGTPLNWALQGNEADGDYRYEAVVVIDDQGTARQGRASALFEVKDSVVIPPVIPAPRASRSNLWSQSLTRTLGDVLTALVPAARAADLRIDDSSPQIFFDDSDDEDGTNLTKDWEIRASGGVSDLSTNNQFYIAAWEGNDADDVVSLFSHADNNTDNSLVIYYDGTVYLADYALAVNRSTGRVGIGTATPTDTLHVKRSDNTARMLVEETGSGGNQALLYLKKTINAPFQRYESQYGLWDFSAGNFFVINDPADAAIEFKIDKAGNLTVTGSVTSASSRAVKQDFETIDARGILAKVMALPITQWSYKNDTQARYVGPMAEDFYAAFGLGATDKGIASLDTGGVALAAIQGLKAEKDAESALRDEQIVALKTEEDAELLALKREKDAEVAALENVLQQEDTELRQFKAEKDAQLSELKSELSELKRIVTALSARGQVAAVTGSQ